MRAQEIVGHRQFAFGGDGLHRVEQGAGDRWNSATKEEIEEGLNPTPFLAEIFEPALGDKISADVYLTNKQLWMLLKPDSNSLPYVYDDFTTWGSCDFDPFPGNDTKPY